MHDIRLVEKIEPKISPGLGLRSLKLTPSKQYLLGGYCDNKMRLISTLSWKESFSFDHAARTDTLDDSNSNADLNIYVESETAEDGPLYEAVSKPFKLDKLSNEDMGKIREGLPRVGISKMIPSYDSNYVATVCESVPNCVWIWDLQKLTLSSLIV